MKTYIRRSRAANRLLASRRAKTVAVRALALVAAVRRGRRRRVRQHRRDPARGTTGGTTLTVYSSLPTPGRGVSRDIADGEKLALAEVHGRIGKYTINFSSLDEAGAGAAEAARTAMADTQTSALIGSVDSQGARASIPLLNETGVLHVSLGAGYAGFTEPAGAGRARALVPVRPALVRPPRRRRPRAGARARARGGRGADRGRGRGRRERAGARRPGAAGGGRVGPPSPPGQRGAVIYAGDDPVNAAGVVESIARESPGARVVLPDELVRAGVDDRLRGRAARAAVLVSRAPAPGSTPALRAFEAAFERTYGREPGPYAALGHAAMTTVLAALTRAARTTTASAESSRFARAPARDRRVLRRRHPEHGGRAAHASSPTACSRRPRFSTYRLKGGQRVYGADR